MSGDEIRNDVLQFLRRNPGSSSRAVRAAVTARAARVDEALRALLMESRVDRSNDVWYALRSDGTRCGHAAARRRSPSGAQISYFKALDALAGHFQAFDGMNRSNARGAARAVLRPALPEKQRERLDRSING